VLQLRRWLVVVNPFSLAIWDIGRMDVNEMKLKYVSTVMLTSNIDVPCFIESFLELLSAGLSSSHRRAY
jgi:hypothetical protein